jgi:hypothetical protein
LKEGFFLMGLSLCSGMTLSRLRRERVARERRERVRPSQRHFASLGPLSPDPSPAAGGRGEQVACFST